MKTINLKKILAIFALFIIIVVLISYYFLSNNSTNVPKSATLVKIIIHGCDING